VPHLRRLAIRGFRSIVKANLQLGEITVIIGPSDCGKTNVVRALDAWAYNIAGTSFTTEGQQMTRVAVVVGAQDKIVFEKSMKGKKKGGASRFYYQDGKTNERLGYEKVGLTVPVEITDITLIRRLVIDDLKLKINFSRQDDPWFLLAPQAWTPDRVSKVIGQISGVDALILANKDLVNKRVALNREARSARERSEESREQLKDYENLDEINDLVGQAKLKLAGIQEDKLKLTKALGLVRRIAEARRTLKRLDPYTKALKVAVRYADSSNLLPNARRLGKAEEIASKLDKLRVKQNKSKNTVELARGRLQGCCDLLAEFAKDDKLQCPLCGGPAHKGCRTAIARQAKAAKDQAR